MEEWEVCSKSEPPRLGGVEGGIVIVEPRAPRAEGEVVAPEIYPVHCGIQIAEFGIRNPKSAIPVILSKRNASPNL